MNNSTMKMFFCALTAMGFLGCASTMSYEQIVQTAKSTNAADGIDQQEAKVLAQHYLIQNGLDAQHSVYRVGQVIREGDKWAVQFNSGVSRGASQMRQFDFVQPITVKVDAKTGDAGL